MELLIMRFYHTLSTIPSYRKPGKNYTLYQKTRTMPYLAYEK